MAEHTPGPWSTSAWTTPTGIIRRGIFHRSGRLAIVEGGTNAGTHAQVEANARLIAAAPELLARLKEMRGNYGPARSAGFGLDALLASVDAAIAEAEGHGA